MYLPGQQALFHHCHSEELVLFHKAAQNYHWDRIERQIAPAFKEAAEQFHRQVKQQSSCPHNKAAEGDGDENLALFELSDFRCDKPQGAIFEPERSGSKTPTFHRLCQGDRIGPDAAY